MRNLLKLKSLLLGFVLVLGLVATPSVAHASGYSDPLNVHLYTQPDGTGICKVIVTWDGVGADAYMYYTPTRLVYGGALPSYSGSYNFEVNGQWGVGFDFGVGQYFGAIPASITLFSYYNSLWPVNQGNYGTGVVLPVDASCPDTLQVGGPTNPPLAAPTQAPAANANGWNNSDVTVNWNWTDTGSGIDTSNCTQSSTTTGEGGAITLASTCSDLAGNTASASYTLKVDKTSPIVTFDGNAGTYTVNQSVSISCSASDALSGVASQTCTNVSGPAWSFGLGTHTVSATAIDNASNIGSNLASFEVTVDEASLSALVQSFSTNSGIANSLGVKLNAAAAAAVRGDLKTKANILSAFENGVAAQSGKAFTEYQAGLLTRFARTL